MSVTIKVLKNASLIQNKIANYNLYDPAKSSTYQANGAPFEIKYVDNAGATGTLCSDNLSMAGLTVLNQTFAQVETFPADGATDGMLGMGFSTGLAVSNSPTPFENLVVQNNLRPVFSFWLNRWFAF